MNFEHSKRNACPAVSNTVPSPISEDLIQTVSRSGSRVLRTLPAMAGLAFLLAISSGCQSLGYKRGGIPKGGIRAVWVTRWDYKSRHDIARIMHNCRSAGFNTVLFQVRGNGTAFYRSRLEPWADELGGRDPGFDPLAVACKEAHRRGLQLHAWFNVIPGWRGKEPPSNPRQLYHARANWFWRDAFGRREPLGWYNSLNPCYPEVRRYLVDVMREVVAGYPIDGLHLDYIRFPNEWNEAYGKNGQVPDYPRDPRTLALFKRETGRTPEAAPAVWDQWRTDKITQIVVGARKMIRQVNPSVRLSAAVGARWEEARRTHFQDARKWIAMGLLDAVYPMNYAENMREFEANLKRWADVRSKVVVVTGVMFDKRSPSLIVRQLARVRQATRNFAAFAYNSLFERTDGHGRPEHDEQNASRAGLRKRVIPYVRRSDWRSA